MARTAIPPDRWPEVRAHYDAGESLRTIAKQYGVSHEAIRGGVHPNRVTMVRCSPLILACRRWTFGIWRVSPGIRKVTHTVDILGNPLELARRYAADQLEIPSHTRLSEQWNGGDE
jgi:hypothetical protein